MRKGQRGVSIMGLLTALVLLIVVALFGMKTVPSVLQYRTAKNAIDAVARQAPQASAAEVRRSLQARSAIDDINFDKVNLDISKDGNQVVISFAYRDEIALFGPIGLYIDYAATTRGSQ